MKSKLLIILLLMLNIPVMSQTTVVTPSVGRAGENISVLIPFHFIRPVNYAHIVLRSNSEFHILGRLPYLQLTSTNLSIAIPRNTLGNYSLIVEILEFRDGFEPNKKSIGEIIRNLISIEDFNQNITILPYILNPLGTGYHQITWKGANIHPMLGFAGINYTYIYWWDNQRYIHYSNITGYGDLTMLQTNEVYSYYEL